MELSVMAENPVQNLQTEIPPLPLFLDLLQKPYSLNIMQKGTNSIALGNFGEEALPVMPKGGVADVMSQGYGLNQIFIEPQKTADGPGNFRHKLNMKYPMGDMVMFNQIKDLGLVYITGVGQGVEDTVRIQGEMLSMTGGRIFIRFSPDGLGTFTGPWRQQIFLILVQLMFDLN
jgi:hypothetical protein